MNRFILAFLVLLAVPAFAEDEQPKTLEERVAVLEEAIAALNPDAIRDLSAKISRIEVSLRELTGMSEESNHGVRQITRKYDNFSADMEERVAILEEKLRSAEINPAAGDAESSSANVAPAKAEELYEYALNRFLAKKDYINAAEAFQGFLDQFPEHPKAGEAYYWLGELYYVQGAYRQAAQNYLEGYRSYGNSSKAADSLLKLGVSLASLGQNREACDTFAELSGRFPNAPVRISRVVERERQRIPCT